MVARRVESAASGGGATASVPGGRRSRSIRESLRSFVSMERRTPRRWPVHVLVAVLAVLAFDLYGLLDKRQVNARLARGELALVAERDTLRGRLARAHRLHASGSVQEAIDAYGAIGAESDLELRKVQYFNLANLYLERAVELERADELQPAMSLVELAKQNYREILAADPHHWDSRHNLSRALEMLPDVAAVDYENERNPERSPQAPRAARTYEGLP